MLNYIKAIPRSFKIYLKNKLKERHYNRLIGNHIIPDAVANNIIYEKILNESPCFISRFGSSELEAILFYQNERAGKLVPREWNTNHRLALCNSSGYFPFSQDAMDLFPRYYYNLIQNIDILGVWKIGEEHISDRFKKDIKFINLPAIEPYYFEKPWSRALAGKKVLVIHPFAKSITNQFAKKHSLFPGTNVLPDFDLKVIPAVQTLADNTQGFSNWFAALDSICDKVSKVDFDVALIGAGAYGMPIANFVKQEKQKVAIHMGGALQILFGIKGKRWNDMPQVKAFYNENWVTPLLDEKPSGSERVEGGCYW